MAYETTAITFFGLPVHEEDVLRNVESDSVIEVGCFGDCHGARGQYIAAKASIRKAVLGGITRSTSSPFDIPAWYNALIKFCKLHDVAMPDAGPGWYVTAERS
jgi:hypothetical protein